MRCGRRAVRWTAAVGGALLLAPAWGFGQGGDSALKDRVAQLVERLGAGRPEAQAAAEKALVDLGERALPFLPAGGPQAARLDKVRQAVREKAEASINLGASTVTLRGQGIRLTEAIRALQAQTGNVINDLREANGEEATNPALDLDLQARPFFEALDLVAEKAGVKITPYTGDGSIGLMAGAAAPPDPAMPAPGKPLVVYSGPFRVEFKQLAIVRDFNMAAGTATAQFEVLWEPRLRPMLLAVRNEDLAIADEQGRAVAPQVKDQADETALRAGNCAAELNLALAAPERSATKLASLRVKGAVTVPSGMKIFRFPSLLAKDVTEKQGDIAVTFDEMAVDEQFWKVQLSVTYPGEGPAFASYRQGLFNNRIWLQKADGSRFEQNGGQNNSGADGGQITFEYLFVDAPGKPGDHSLVYEAPSKIVPIPLEFEFKDVPLP